MMLSIKIGDCLLFIIYLLLIYYLFITYLNIFKGNIFPSSISTNVHFRSNFNMTLRLLSIKTFDYTIYNYWSLYMMIVTIHNQVT